MLPFGLDLAARPRRLVVLAAHPDDLEIGCGGTLLRLATEVPDLSVKYVLATGTPERLDEARAAAELFLPGVPVELRTGGLPDGRLPSHWEQVKEFLEESVRGTEPDLILAPSRGDAHQDHRMLAELVSTVWRDHLILNYEIPKWDGDFGRPSLYVPLTRVQALAKVERLSKAFPSQAGHDWFDDEVFLGLARLRGMECRAPYAEAFTTGKAIVTW